MSSIVGTIEVWKTYARGYCIMQPIFNSRQKKGDVVIVNQVPCDKSIKSPSNHLSSSEAVLVK